MHTHARTRSCTRLHFCFFCFFFCFFFFVCFISFYFNSFHLFACRHIPIAISSDSVIVVVVVRAAAVAAILFIARIARTFPRSGCRRPCALISMQSSFCSIFCFHSQRPTPPHHILDCGFFMLLLWQLAIPGQSSVVSCSGHFCLLFFRHCVA